MHNNTLESRLYRLFYITFNEVDLNLFCTKTCVCSLSDQGKVIMVGHKIDAFLFRVRVIHHERYGVGGKAPILLLALAEP